MKTNCKYIAVIDTQIKFNGDSYKITEDSTKLYVTAIGEPIQTSKNRSDAVEFDSNLTGMEFLETMFKIYPNGGYTFEKV